MQGPRGRSGLKGDRGDAGEPVSAPRKSGKNWDRGGKNLDQEQMASTGSRSKTRERDDSSQKSSHKEVWEV